VYAVDRDPQAIAIAKEFATATAGKVVPVPGRFGDLTAILEAQGVPVGSVDGIVLDVGVSSMQLDDPARGFSFRNTGPLDMRMDGLAADTLSAADLVNTASEEQLANIIRTLSNEKKAKGIAGAIVTARRRFGGFHTTEQLAAVVEAAVGGKDAHTKPNIHPATRTFQALRIFVNNELGELDDGLTQAARHLSPGGRIAVATFHSLELHLVRRFARQSAKAELGDTLGGRFRWRGPIVPTLAEVESNPRARSATLMIGEKLPPCDGDSNAEQSKANQ
jgi:16S rRNA (cytosine1402-N4)-methyltransferase